MKQVQHILIRLPNWLGDMVMSTAFVKAVHDQYPDATIDVIAKKGIDFLLDYFPVHSQRFIFNKEEYSGLTGAYKFGRQIQKQKKYDIFFCLPDSLSSAVMGLAIGAKKRIGYTKELRSALLTNAYHKKKNIHRVEEYIDLLQQFLKREINVLPVELKNNARAQKNAVIVNINSEASSRRLPKEKAVSVINLLRKNIDTKIILVGSNKEAIFVEEVFNALDDKNNISNMAGKTNLQELLILLGSCTTMLTTDSGPAHVANALGTHTIVLFGAGNENNTAPYNQPGRTIIRLGALPCEPCVSNTCKVFGTPECLLRLDDNMIVQNVITILKNKKHN
ncbi:lipopolysaccharide heptosyltransferase II [Ferruginibacter sp. SUN106]|uniref:lipopolysaccharide heptosyltransferase II n=1 Tax=Ferruginibacter sp. SUN106 TaxID=2978348 RepID=UPI003D36D450